MFVKIHAEEIISLITLALFKVMFVDFPTRKKHHVGMKFWFVGSKDFQGVSKSSCEQIHRHGNFEFGGAKGQPLRQETGT